MLRTPEGFEADLGVALDDDAIAHVFIRDALVQFGDSPGAFPWRHYRAAGLVAARAHPIGRHGGRAHVAVGLDDASGTVRLPDGLRSAGLRSWFGVVDDATMSIAMRAVQVLEWDRTHRFCGACGAATVCEPRERARTCPACGLSQFPRLAPAIIVAVEQIGRAHV